MAFEQLDGELLQYAGTYSTVDWDGGNEQSEWTIRYREDTESQEYETVTLDNSYGLVWQSLCEEDGWLRIVNSNSNFGVILHWEDDSDALSMRPEHVTLTLEQKETDDDGNVTWTPVQTVTGSGEEHPLGGSFWMDDDYDYLFPHIDTTKEYRVRLSAAATDTEGLLQEYVITYDDSLNVDSLTQLITAELRPSLKVQVEWMDAENRDDNRPDSLIVQLMKQVTDEDGNTTMEAVTDSDGNPVTATLTKPESGENVNGVGYWRGTFANVVEDVNAVYAARVVGAEKDGDIIRFEDAGTYAVTYQDYKQPVSGADDFVSRVILTAQKEYEVTKSWKVDLLGSDEPEELGVILQKKDGDKWSDTPAQRLTLKSSSGWKGTFAPVDRYTVKSDTTEEKDGKQVRTVVWEDGEPGYRVREISEAKLKAVIDEYVDKATGDLPDEVKNYIDEHNPTGSILDWAAGVVDGSGVPDVVKNWTKQYLQDSIPDDGGEITLDVSDSDGGHQTKYLVSYEEDGDTTKITNTAILDVTIYKKWLMFGAAEDKIPDSVYLMLMSRSILPGGDETSSEVPYANVYLPVHKIPLIPGGTLVDGDAIDLPVVGKVIAIGEAKKPDDDDSDSKGWQVTFRVKKYNDEGLEQEYKGAELVSGSISTIAGIALNAVGLGSLADITNYISVNPVNGYLSLSHKAVKVPSSIPLVGDDTHLYSMVVNTWVGFDPAIGGVKEWEDDENKGNTRPVDEDGNVKPVTLHIFDGGTELGTVECGPDSEWTWVFTEYTDPDTGETKKLDEAKVSAGEYTVVEDPVPEGYAATYDGLNVTNTLAALKVTNTVYNSGEANNPEFTYTLTLDKADVTELEVLYTRQGTAKQTAETLTAQEGRFTFILKSGESMTVRKLQGAGTYTLTQTAPDEGWTTVITGSESGELQGTVQVDYVNSKPIVVTGTKTVEGESLPAAWKESFTFTLEAEEAKADTFEAKNAEDGTFSFRFTPADWNALPEVTVTEAAAPEECVTDGEPHAVTLAVKEDENGILQVTAEPITIDNKLKGLTIKVQKQWRGGEPVELKAVLEGRLGDVQDIRELVLNEDNDWEETVEEVPCYILQDGTVKAWEWTAAETVPEGWTQLETETETVNGDEVIEKTFTLINAMGDTTTVSGQKTWEKPDEVRLPEKVTVTLKIKLDDEVIEGGERTVEITANDDWAYKFENVPVKDAEGRAYEYEITEEPSGLPEGGAYGQVNAEDNETGGVDFTNRWQESISLTVAKEWDDEDDKEGLRPDSLTVHVSGGELDRDVTLTADGNWTAVLTELPRWEYDEDGKAEEIEYTVTEPEVAEYETMEAAREPEAGYTEGKATYIVKNKLVPGETATVSGKKTWLAPEGTELPDSVTITLRVMLNGRTIEDGELTAEATADTDWVYTFKNVPVKDRKTGTAYTYAISEEETDGWKLQRKVANSTGGVDFTNVREGDATVSLTVTKVWQDSDNALDYRPESVTVTVSGGDTEREIILSAANDWTAELSDLPHYQYSDSGEAAEIEYTLTEERVKNYDDPEIVREPEEGYTDGQAAFTVTNRVDPDNKTVSGRKLWQKPGDAPLPDRVTITLKLQLDGETIENGELTADATADTGWTYTFEDVPSRGENDEKYTFVITEQE